MSGQTRHAPHKRLNTGCAAQAAKRATKHGMCRNSGQTCNVPHKRLHTGCAARAAKHAMRGTSG